MERELLLLGILRRQDMHGYQIHEFIERYLSTCTDMKKSTAYFLLDKMKAAGWVVDETVQEGHRPPRKVYRLTALGEQTYAQLLRANLAAYAPALFPGDTGLAFMDDLPRAEAVALLEQRRAALHSALAHWQHLPPHQGSLNLIFDHQRHHLQAELAWLEQALNQLTLSSGA